MSRYRFVSPISSVIEHADHNISKGCRLCYHNRRLHLRTCPRGTSIPEISPRDIFHNNYPPNHRPIITRSLPKTPYPRTYTPTMGRTCTRDRRQSIPDNRMGADAFWRDCFQRVLSWRELGTVLGTLHHGERVYCVWDYHGYYDAGRRSLGTPFGALP